MLLKSRAAYDSVFAVVNVTQAERWFWKNSNNLRTAKQTNSQGSLDGFGKIKSVDLTHTQLSLIESRDSGETKVVVRNARVLERSNHVALPGR